VCRLVKLQRPPPEIRILRPASAAWSTTSTRRPACPPRRAATPPRPRQHDGIVRLRPAHARCFTGAISRAARALGETLPGGGRHHAACRAGHGRACRDAACRLRPCHSRRWSVPSRAGYRASSITCRSHPRPPRARCGPARR
jgi:hypothetical protein